MNHTVGDKNVGVDDTSGINEDGAVVGDGDLDVLAVESGQAGVAEGGAVADGALDDVVLQNLRELVVCDVGGAAGNPLESIVVGAEDGDVRQVFERGYKVCLGSGSGKCSEIAGDESLRDAEWDEQQLVNDVDDTVVKFDVL